MTPLMGVVPGHSHVDQHAEDHILTIKQVSMKGGSG
jgi:hypothetical protein